MQNQATLDGSPVAQAVIKCLEYENRFDGTPSELHKELEPVAEKLGVNRCVRASEIQVSPFA